MSVVFILAVSMNSLSLSKAYNITYSFHLFLDDQNNLAVKARSVHTFFLRRHALSVSLVFLCFFVKEKYLWVTSLVIDHFRHWWGAYFGIHQTMSYVTMVKEVLPHHPPDYLWQDIGKIMAFLFVSRQRLCFKFELLFVYLLCCRLFLWFYRLSREIASQIVIQKKQKADTDTSGQLLFRLVRDLCGEVLLIVVACSKYRERKKDCKKFDRERKNIVNLLLQYNYSFISDRYISSCFCFFKIQKKSKPQETYL